MYMRGITEDRMFYLVIYSKCLQANMSEVAKVLFIAKLLTSLNESVYNGKGRFLVLQLQLHSTIY